MNKNSHLYSINDVDSDKFYRLQKDLFTLLKYANLTNEARVLYAILKDRLDLSMKNNWIDEDGYVYFNYSRESIGQLLKVSKNTAKKRFEELKSVGLLIEKEQSSGKSLRLYLCKIISDEKYIKSENTRSKIGRGSKFDPVKTSSGEGQSLHPNDTNPSILNSIYSHFNSKNIIKHSTLTKEICNSINNALKIYSEKEIIQAIDNYTEVLNSNYFYNYRWTLGKFLKQKNGISQFLENGSMWINYKSSRKSREGVRCNQPTTENKEKSGFRIILEDDM